MLVRTNEEPLAREPWHDLPDSGVVSSAMSFLWKRSSGPLALLGCLVPQLLFVLLSACGDDAEVDDDTTVATGTASATSASSSTTSGAGGDAGVGGNDGGGPSTCDDGTIRVLECGLNDRGEQAQYCADGAWTDEGDCDDPDDCQDGADDEEPCGSADLGMRELTCVEGVWEGGACDAFPLLSAAIYQTCAATESGDVYCWGGEALSPVRVDGITDVRVIAVGAFHACAITDDGTLHCWGSNTSGELGDGSTESRDTPAPVDSLSGLVSVVAEGGRTCAATNEGALYCWGSNAYRTLGLGSSSDDVLSPTLVEGIADVVAVRGSMANTCAVTGTGQLYCWGVNAAGTVGDGTTQTRATPVLVDAISDVRDVTVGGSNVCAVTQADVASCWGSNSDGQLGDGTTTPQATPTPVVGLTDIRQISANYFRACAVTNADELYCWGSNANGRLGLGHSLNESVLTPSRVESLDEVANVSAAANHTCATTFQGNVFCWGSRLVLGDGTDLPSELPVLVAF